MERAERGILIDHYQYQVEGLWCYMTEDNLKQLVECMNRPEGTDWRHNSALFELEDFYEVKHEFLALRRPAATAFAGVLTDEDIEAAFAHSW